MYEKVSVACSTRLWICVHPAGGVWNGWVLFVSTSTAPELRFLPNCTWISIWLANETLRNSNECHHFSPTSTQLLQRMWQDDLHAESDPGSKQANNGAPPVMSLPKNAVSIITFWSVQHSQYPIRIVQSQTQHGSLKPCGRLISTWSCWIAFFLIFDVPPQSSQKSPFEKYCLRNILQAFVWKKSKFHPCWTNAAPPLLGTQRCRGFTSVCRVQNAVLQIWNLQDLVLKQWVFWRWWLLCNFF